MEQYAIDDDETDQAPLCKLDVPVPHWRQRLEFYAALELALKSELLFLCHLAEVWRPCFSGRKAIASEVKRRKFFLLSTEQACEQTHDDGRSAESVGYSNTSFARLCTFEYLTEIQIDPSKKLAHRPFELLAQRTFIQPTMTVRARLD